MISDVFKEGRRGDVRPGWLLNVVVALQVAHPGVAWMFAETPRLAQEWARRWLAACAAADLATADHPARPIAIGEPQSSRRCPTARRFSTGPHGGRSC